MIYYLSVTKNENTSFLFYHCFTVVLQGLSHNLTDFQFIAWTVRFTVWCRGLCLWTHLCNKKKRFLYVFLFRSSWEFPPEFPSPVCHQFLLPHVGLAQPVFYSVFTVSWKRSGKQAEEKTIKQVFVTLSILCVLVFLCVCALVYVWTSLSVIVVARRPSVIAT